MEEMTTDALELYCRNLSKAKNDLTEYGRALLMDVSARLCELQSRTAEDDKAREEGRLVVLPCKVGDDVFTMRWSIKNEKYEVFAGKVKNVRYDAIDGSVMVSDGEYYREWGKNAFSSRQAAEAALGGGEGG